MNTWSILGMFFVSDTHSTPASEGNSLDIILTQVWKMQQPNINNSFNPSSSARMLATQACHKEVEKSSILQRQIVETMEKGNHLSGLEIFQPNHTLVYYLIVHHAY